MRQWVVVKNSRRLRLILLTGVLATSGWAGLGPGECGRTREPQQQVRADPQKSDEVPGDIGRLIRMIQSDDSDRRELGATYLAESGRRAAPALPSLLPLLEDRADAVCAAAVRAICAIGPEAAPAIPAIVKSSRRRLSESPDEGTCWAIPYTCSLGPEAVPYLVAELGRDPNTDEIPENMLSDSELGGVALPAVEGVLEEGGYRAQSAASVLSRMGSRARSATGSLIKALRQGKVTDFTFSSTMSQIGSASQEAIRELERIARESEDLRARDAAKTALGKR